MREVTIREQTDFSVPRFLIGLILVFVTSIRKGVVIEEVECEDL